MQDTTQQVAFDTAQAQVYEAMSPQQQEAEDNKEAGVAPEPQDGEDEASYEDETKAELKEELANRDLPTSGNKDELVHRLEEDDQKS